MEPRVLLENVKVGVESLRIHPLRTVLSVLGILIGSAALIATMAVSDGMMSFAREQVLRNTSALLVTVSPRTSVYQDGEWMPTHDYPIFTTGDAEALRRLIPGVDAAALTLGGRASASLGAVRCRAAVTFATAGLTEFQTRDLVAGRFFSEGEVARNAAVIVVNYALATELSSTRSPLMLVGRIVRVNGRSRRVIGIQAPTGFEDRSDPAFQAFAPIRAASALLPTPAGASFAPSIMLRASTAEEVDDVRAAAIDWLSRRYPRGQDKARVIVAAEQLHQVELAFLIMKTFVAALVGISLLVGGIGIMNVLLAAVTERTREIGIRKSVGARAADIHAQFVAESVAIALAGAMAGLVFGFTVAALVTAVFRYQLGAPIHPVLTVGSVLTATLSSSLVGLVFGTYPARRAAKLPPIEALAHE